MAFIWNVNLAKFKFKSYLTSWWYHNINRAFNRMQKNCAWFSRQIVQDKKMIVQEIVQDCTTLPKIIIIINPFLIWFYPRKRGWPDLPHSASNLSHSHSPSCSILCILLTNTLKQNKIKKNKLKNYLVFHSLSKQTLNSCFFFTMIRKTNSSCNG